MTDLDQPSTHSPRRKNFSFRFPNLSHSTSHDKDSSQMNGNGSHTLNQGLNYAGKDRRNFSEEAKNVPDLQVSVLVHFPRCRFESTNTMHQEMVILCSYSSFRVGKVIQIHKQTYSLLCRLNFPSKPNLTFARPHSDCSSLTTLATQLISSLNSPLFLDRYFIINSDL